MEHELLETKELDSRKNDGLTVTLWWVKNTMQTFVTVLDTKPNPPIEHHIDVPEGVSPYDIFNHPMPFMESA
jgi:hypothetical protein